MKNLKILLSCILSTVFLIPSNTEASSLPSVDLKSVNLGVGLISTSLSLDFPVTSNLFTGVSASLPIYYPGEFYGTLRYDLHFVYQIIKEQKSNLSFLMFVLDMLVNSGISSVEFLQLFRVQRLMRRAETHFFLIDAQNA